MTLEGGGLVDLPRADRPLVFTEPASLSFQDLNVNRSQRQQSAGRSRHRRRRRRRHVAGGAGAAIDVERCVARRAAGPLRPARRRGRPRRGGPRQRGCRGRRGLRLHPAAARRGHAQDSLRVLRRTASARAAAAEAARALPARRHRQRTEPCLHVLLPGRTVRPAAGLRRPTDERERHGDALRHEHRQARRQPRRRNRDIERRGRASTPGSSAPPTSATCRGTRELRSTSTS